MEVRMLDDFGAIKIVFLRILYRVMSEGKNWMDLLYNGGMFYNIVMVKFSFFEHEGLFYDLISRKI